MKTYSRKSSSYLKKAFIASNFNEMCRLCLSEVDMVLMPIIHESQMSYQDWIKYSVDVLVEEGDGLPPNICEECLAMVEQTYLFKKKCKASDSKLREHLKIMTSNENKLMGIEFESEGHNNEETTCDDNMLQPNLVDPGGKDDYDDDDDDDDDIDGNDIDGDDADGDDVDGDDADGDDVDGDDADADDADADGDDVDENDDDDNGVDGKDVDSKDVHDNDVGDSNEKDAGIKESGEDEVNTEVAETQKLSEKPKGSEEKEIVKPITEDNIIINEVKRYLRKNEKSGEKSGTVFEVVHYDIRKEGEDSNDESDSDSDSINNENSSTSNKFKQCDKNITHDSSDSAPVQQTTVKSINGNEGSETSEEAESGTDKCEAKIEEIRQLWDNDDEAAAQAEARELAERKRKQEELRKQEEKKKQEEREREERKREERKREERKREEQKREEQKVAEAAEVEEVEELVEVEEIEELEEIEEVEEVEMIAVAESMVVKNVDLQDHVILNMMWEPKGAKEGTQTSAGIVEVKFEENGIIQTRKVYPSEGCIQLMETVPGKREFKCFNCNKHFRSQVEMRNHVLSMHREVTNVSFCDICYKSFTSPNSLKRHMLVHTGIKPFPCDICGRRFTQTSILKRHRYTHGRRKPFACTFCQKSYTQKMNLITHLRNHGIKMDSVGHRCKLCQKTFVHPSGLSRHLKQHKGIRFCCTRCCKSFTDSSALSRHIKTVHNAYNNSPL